MFFDNLRGTRLLLGMMEAIGLANRKGVDDPKKSSWPPERRDHKKKSIVLAVKSHHQNGEWALSIKRLIFFAFLCG